MATMADVRRIVWSIYWKSVLASVVAGVIVGALIGFVLGFIAAATGGMTPNWVLAIQVCSGLGGFIAGFLCLNFFVARAIGKNIAGKTLALNEVGR